MSRLITAPRLLPVTIVVLVGLLALKSFGLLRLAASAQQASLIATTPASVKPGPPAQTQISVEPAVPDAERALLLQLRQRREELEARAATIAQREAVLAATEKKLTTRAEELSSLQRKLEAMEAARQQRDEAGWQGLVKVYESMKPRDAAAIFNDLQMQVLVHVLDRMKESKAAPILAAMNADRAREITAELARLRSSRPDAQRESAPAMPPGG